MNARTTTRCLGLLTRTALLLGLLLNSSMGWAQIAAWDFFGENTGVATSAADLYNAGLDASSNITRGATAGASTANNSFRTAGFANNGISTANTDFFQITLSASGSSTLSLSTIDARFAGTATYAVSPGVSNQFAYSLDGTNFTLIGSAQALIGTPATLTQISLTGISALQNVSAATTITIRYYASGQTGTGGWGFNSPSAGAYGLAIGGTVNAPPPSIGTPVPTSLTGFTTTQGTPSTTQTFSITGSNLVADLVCAAQSTDFEVREQGTPTFSSSVSFTPSSGSVSRVVEVRLTGTTVGTPSSSVVCSSGTASSQSVTVSGTVNPNSGPDCLGTIGGTALPGTGCDDLNACTSGETWSAACVCQGGTFQDADGDGTCDANDGCPNDPLKTAAGTCGCGNPEPGATCDDGDPCTINDVLTSCSTCAGTTTPDSDGDGVCDGEDGCPNDPSKIFPGLCGCGVLEVGNVCDDGNACTLNDIYVSCGVCAGTAPSAAWNFTTAANTSNSIPSTTMGSFSSGNSFGTTTLISATSPSSGYAGVSGVNNGGVAARAGALNTGASGSAYFEFTVTPAASYGFTLNGISFGTRSTGSGPVSYSLRSSTDSYASEVAGGAISANSVWSLKSNSGLSAASAGDQPVTFRLYGYGSVGNPSSGTVNWRIDDVTISGCTTVLPGFPLLVNFLGAGTGTVTSSPAGINCSSAPCQATFYQGTMVTMTATPSPGSVFTQWVGGPGCDGPVSCVFSVPTIPGVFAIFDLDSDGDGIGDATDDCQATSAVTGSPLFNAATCGANPGAYLTFTPVNSIQVRTSVSTCPAGSSCAGGDAPPEVCGAGSFSSTTGASTCSSCAASCGAGTVETQACTSTTDRVCDLDADNDGIPDVIDACQATAAVTGSPLFNAATCGANPGAYLTYTDVSGVQVATDVTTCPAGSSCAGGTAPAVACPAGKFSDVTGSAVCQDCAAGSFSSVTGSVFCQSCAAGSFSSFSGATECTACAAGSFSSVTGATECTSCAAGTFSDVEGSTVCQSCAAGTFSSATGATACTSCAAGTFSDVEGSTQCTACAAGTFSAALGSVSCQSCAAGTVSTVVGSTECTSCASGTYNPFTGATECLTCTGGTDATTGAAVCLDYPGSPYCPTGSATPTLSGGSGGALYTCSNGACSSLVMNPATGEVDLAASAPGTYTVCASGACVELVIRPPVSLNPPSVALSSGTNPTCSSSAVEFHATGTYSDGSAYDSDVSYVWSPNLVTIQGSGFFAVPSPSSGQVSVSVTTTRACATNEQPVFSSNSIDLVVTPVLSLVASSLAIEQTVGSSSTCSGSSVEFHLTGLYSDGSSATNDLSATWAHGTITIVGQSFAVSADASSSSVSASSVTSSRSCVSNSGSVQSPPDFALSVTESVSLSSASLALSSGTNPTCSGSPRAYTAFGTFTDGSTTDSRPPGETQYDFYLNGALVQSSTNPLYEDDGQQSNPLFVTVSSSRACLTGASSLDSPPVSLQVLVASDYALDADNDNFYVTSSVVSACSPPSTLHRLVSVMVSAGGGADDCDDSRASVHPLASEQCDDLDNDCDVLTAVDAGCDDDNDGYCDFSLVTTTASTCASGGGDCDDTDASRNPGASEVCDGVDQDCDGSADDGLVFADFALDADNDNFYVTSSVVSACSPPSTLHRLVSVMVSAGGGADDCDDSRASVHPLASEQCDDLDNDCDVLTAIDAGCDDDNDGYCDFSLVTTTASTCASGGGDCDDTDASRNPGASEVCDGEDDDCDGTADDGLVFADFALDADNDNFYVTSSVVSACSAPSTLHRLVSVMVSAGGGADDCDDSDASVHPGATETCDGQDNDCDGTMDEQDYVFFADADADGDGAYEGTWTITLIGSCTLPPQPPAGFATTHTDCDDADATVRPGAPELCDGKDNDCSGSVSTNEIDNDGDNYVECSFSGATWPVGSLVVGGDDCDDTDASRNPGEVEVCDPADTDEDCDFSSTNGLVFEDFALDADLDNFYVTSSVVSACSAPSTLHRLVSVMVAAGGGAGDCDDSDASVHPGATETCDGQDNDCDGTMDEQDYVFFADADADGDGGYEGTTTITVVGSCTLPPQPPAGFASTHTDCDDADASVFAGAPELCDGKDNDCSGSLSTDEIDNDGDNYVECSFSGATWPVGSLVVGGDDCDDTDASRNPGASEVCDGVDQDCDGSADDGLVFADFALDADNDNFYVTSSVVSACSAPSTLHRLVSVMVSAGGGADDCDDSRASVHPSASEVCDGIDNDCDGLVPSGETDDDGDGYVECAYSSTTWGGTVLVFGGFDCNDADASIHPGATEVCDPLDVDEDCDFSSTNGLVFVDYAIDADNDNYFVSGSVVSECTAPGAPYRPLSVLVSDGDCDDGDASVHPGATETCDNQDEDCDGFVDEGSNLYFADSDADGFGDALVSVSLVCTAPPSGFVSNSDDCDDTRLLYPDLDGDGIGAGAPVACGVQSNTDDCPNVQGVIGSVCDDGSTATINDVLSASCVCTGTPACSTNPVTLTLSTDANAAQITWYVMFTGTNTPVCSGNGLASSSTIAVDCCLPNGCYDLVITDSFGDGIVGGGYVLRDGTGKRIIDNAGNGASFTTLSLSPLGFCVPLGADALMATSCDLETATLTTVLRAEPNAAVTAQFGVHNSNSGYQFWVTNPNGGFTRRILFTHAAPGTGAPGGTSAALRSSYFLLSSMNSSAPLIPQGILLNVRVRTQVNGVFSSFGPACRLKIPVPTCATTQLTTTASPVISCGATGLTFSSVIWANAVAGATGYQFEFSKPGYTRRIVSPVRSQALSFVTLPLQLNNCYQVRVRVSFDNSSTYCPFGPYCTITLGTANCGTIGMALEGGNDQTGMADEARLTLWPNPNDGSTLNISLTAFDATVNVVSMDVTDVFGKLVATRTLPVQDGRLNTAVNFDQELAPGLYLVNLTAGEHRYTERLVIQ